MEILTGLIHFGPTGFIAGLLVWKIIPDMLRTFREEMAKERAACEARERRTRRRIERRLVRIEHAVIPKEQPIE